MHHRAGQRTYMPHLRMRAYALSRARNLSAIANALKHHTQIIDKKELELSMSSACGMDRDGSDGMIQKDASFLYDAS